MALAYAQNALSFIFLDRIMVNKCSAIYLFGSAARGEMEKESDLDIFFDFEVLSADSVQNERLIKEKESAIQAAFSRFSKSNDFLKWKLLRFTPQFSVNVGKLEDWELKTSILADGILLYSKELITSLKIIKRHFLIMYELPQKKTKYLSFIRTLFGRKEQGYHDAGLVGVCNGKRIASTALLIPKENAEQIFTYLQREKIEYSFKEVGIIE